MAADPRAIRSQAYGRYNRVIAYNAQALAGLLTKPYDEDNLDGWGPPIRTDDGTPIIPGTPGTLPNRVLFFRGSEAQPAPGSIVRATTFRAFTDPDVLDWRGKEIDGVAGRYPVLHFHGPPARYFPTSSIVSSGFQSFDLLDTTQDHYQDYFYDRNGTILVEGPPLANDKIRGVAVRNQGTASEEYVVITGRAKFAPDGLQFWVRSRSDDEDPWTLIGSHDFSGALGGLSGDAGYAWNVPVHCNQLGTKAVTMTIGGSDGDADKRNRLFRIEFDILSGSVTTSGLVDVTSGNSSVRTERNNSGGTTTTTPTDPSTLPACPTTGSYTVDTTTTHDQEDTTVTTWGATAVAFDYKIDTDDELGKIEMTPESINRIVITGGGSSTLTSQACWNGSFAVVTPGSQNGSGSSSRVTTSERYTRLSISIEGGRHSAVIGPLQTDFEQSGVYTFSTTSETVAGVTTSTESVDQQLTDGDEFIRDFQFFWTFQHEIQWADIRYGSMIVGNRKMFMDRFQFNSENSVGIPGEFGEPPAFIGEVKNGNGQFGIVSTISSAPYVGWAEVFYFRRDTWVESEAFSLKVRNDDGPYAIRSGDPVNLMLLNTLPSIFLVPPPSGETITNTSNPDVEPAFLTQDDQVPVTGERGRGPFGGHDRFGDFFYQHEHGKPGATDNDFAIMRMFGTLFVLFQLIEERTSQADYEFTDPVAAVGIPGDEPGFEPIVCV